MQKYIPERISGWYCVKTNQHVCWKSGGHAGLNKVLIEPVGAVLVFSCQWSTGFLSIRAGHCSRVQNDKICCIQHEVYSRKRIVWPQTRSNGWALMGGFDS